MNEVMLSLSLVFLGCSGCLTLWQIVRGPSLPDRVVALELLTSISVASIAVFGIAAEQSVYLDICAALTLLGFLGSVAFARFLEQRGGTGD